MSVLIALLALCGLMFVAYRGYSVIICAPIAAMVAVLLTDPSAVAPVFFDVFMEKLVGFVKLYFPVFVLGAVFGKLIEISGFSRSIVKAVVGLLGRERAIPVIVAVCGLLTYGGVSLFVVVFAVYPFAAEMFKQSEIPKRLIPATIALGAFTFTMDALPGSPQILNIIPTTFFGTTSWAAPWLGVTTAVFVVTCGYFYLEYYRRKALRLGEGYGDSLRNEPETSDKLVLPNPLIALLPLIMVGVMNLIFTHYIPQWYGSSYSIEFESYKAAVPTQVSKMTAIWAVQAALMCGIVTLLIFAYKTVIPKLAEGSRTAVAGAMLATLNTASEYGFGAVIAILPGFMAVAGALEVIPDPLLKQAVTLNLLAGITGSASGGLSIALGAMADTFVAAAQAAHIPMEVLHRVSSMAAGGMDTLPHSGAVITLLAVTGLTHREAYKYVFGITIFKTLTSFFAITVFYTFGII
ncbi:TPA: GntP family permease [Pseudomonas aeruginosa]|uniref:GntP family permease n=1 Tax=Pseudomonas monteilii TaxID=76759 RepID=A0A399M4X7_9PSED|nr:GntP family permease [Pseudomonas monteilii]RII76831.1 GntP family permease [Pseudomonas monteilii]HCF7274958.1 GntP family permease [Pseudomonas aeruginosa]